MPKTWERHLHAARHQERAAHHYKEAANYDSAEKHEKAASLTRSFVVLSWPSLERHAEISQQ